MQKYLVALVVAVLVVMVAIVTMPRCGSTRSTEPTAAGRATKLVRGVTTKSATLGLAAFTDSGAPDRRIAGRVVFDGKPFTGAKVTAHIWNGLVTPMENGAPLERTSAADGTFDLGLLPPGPFEVVASAPGKVAAIVRVQLANPNARPDPASLVLELQACETSIGGTVRDASGGPIVHAQAQRDGIAGVETDAQGAYELCVPSGMVEVEYSADGYGAVTLSILAELRARHDVVLVPETIVQGIAVDEAGAPVAGAHVMVAPAQIGPERPAQRSAITDTDGRFRVLRLMPGRVRVSAFTQAMSTDGTTEVMAMVGASSDVTLTLVHRASVSGIVMQRGNPVAGTEVIAVRASPAGQSSPSYSQVDGSFVLARVPPGDFVFTTSQHRVVAPAELHVGTAPITGVIVEVEAMGSIGGRVTRRGKPVEGARVCCVERPGGFAVASDANGEYLFEKVDPGTYQIEATSGRLGAFGIQTAVTVALGEAKRVDLDMPFAAKITGTVVDESGAGVAGAIVKFKNPTDEDSCRAVADDRGRFRCAAMIGGTTYAASVYRRAGNEPVMQTPAGKPYPVIDLKNGESVVEDLTITVVVHRGAVRGRVVDTNGAPIVDAQVKASTDATFNRWVALPTTVTDVDGAFAFRDLGGTSYAIEARSPDGGIGTAMGVPVDGAPVTITVTRTGAIEGALVGYTSTPAVIAVPRTAFAEPTQGSVTGATYRMARCHRGDTSSMCNRRSRATSARSRCAPARRPRSTSRRRGAGRSRRASTTSSRRHRSRTCAATR